MSEVISLHQQIESVKRELGMRRRVYPKWVQSRRMTQEKADHEIACMEATLTTLLRVYSQGCGGKPLPPKTTT